MNTSSAYLSSGPLPTQDRPTSSSSNPPPPNVSTTDSKQDDIPIFYVEPAELAFGVTADFAAAQIANNVMVLALHSGRILRIDLDASNEVDGE